MQRERKKEERELHQTLLSVKDTCFSLLWKQREERVMKILFSSVQNQIKPSSITNELVTVKNERSHRHFLLSFVYSFEGFLWPNRNRNIRRCDATHYTRAWWRRPSSLVKIAKEKREKSSNIVFVDWVFSFSLSFCASRLFYSFLLTSIYKF